jgi:hypothetical protein
MFQVCLITENLLRFIVRSTAVTGNGAVAEVFLRAVKALGKKERDEVLQGLLSERRIRKKLLDIALLEGVKADSGEDVRVPDCRQQKDAKP